MTQETKLGLFVLVGLAALVATIVLLGDFQFQRSYKINILFNDIAGLPDKAKAKIAGVEVGAVKNITLEGNQAKVRVWIKSSVKLHTDAQARIASTGIIGSQYLDLTIGNPGLPLLKDGDTIQGEEPMSLNKVVENVMQQFGEIVKIFKGPEGKAMGENLSVTLANLRKVSDSLRVALSDQEGRLTQIVNNVHAFTGDLAEITADNKAELKLAIRNISEMSAKMDRIVARIEGGEGTVGKLVADKEMGDNLKETVSDLKETVSAAKKVVRRLNLIETQWDYKYRYDTRYEYSHNDIGLRIAPNPTKYYYLGMSNVGNTDDKPAGDFEESNTYNLQIGKIYGPVDAYAGIIRSQGGAGVRVKPFWKWNPLSRFEVTAEAYHFSRKNPGKAVVNIGGRVKVARWAYIGAQTEDIYHTAGFNVYANAVIRDDDIAYLLGLVSLAQP